MGVVFVNDNLKARENFQFFNRREYTSTSKKIIPGILIAHFEIWCESSSQFFLSFCAYFLFQGKLPVINLSLQVLTVINFSSFLLYSNSALRPQKKLSVGIAITVRLHCASALFIYFFFHLFRRERDDFCPTTSLLLRVLYYYLLINPWRLVGV